jgi:hypothetical protein
MRESNGQFLIEDLGSTNGTYVNGERILGAQVLKPGDNVELGDTKLTVEALGPPSDEVISPAGGGPPAVTTFAEIPAEAVAPEAERAFEAVERADAALAEAAQAPPEPAPATALLVASSGSISVRVDGKPDGDLELHIDDGQSEARFVRRDGSWQVEP